MGCSLCNAHMVAASYAHGCSRRVGADLPRDAICGRLPLAERDGVGGAPVEEREVPRDRVAQHGAEGDAAAERLVQRAQLGAVRVRARVRARVRVGVRVGVRLSVRVRLRLSLGDVREEGGGKPPLGVQLDDDPPRGDLLRARRRSPRRAGAEAAGPCRTQACAAGRRCAAVAACGVLLLCVRAWEGEGGGSPARVGA